MIFLLKCILACLIDGLMHIMDDLFGGVVYAGIDTDQYKYPIGRYFTNSNECYVLLPITKI